MANQTVCGPLRSNGRFDNPKTPTHLKDQRSILGTIRIDRPDVYRLRLEPEDNIKGSMNHRSIVLLPVNAEDELVI